MILYSQFFLLPFLIYSESVIINIDAEKCLIDKENSIIELTITTLNSTSNSLILYDLMGPVKMEQLSEAEYCDSNITAGLAILLFKENSSEQIWPDVYIPDSIHSQLKNADTYKLFVEKEYKRFAESYVVMKPYERIEFNKEIDLKDYNLQDGIYEIAVIYFTGDNILNLIDVEQVATIENQFSARYFKGCTKSNKIKLIVKK